MEDPAVLAHYQNDILPKTSHKELIQEFEDLIRQDHAKGFGPFEDSIQSVKAEILSRFLPEEQHGSN